MRLGWIAALLTGCGFQVGGTGDAGTGGGERPVDVSEMSPPSSPRKVTFNNANVTANLDNFPVLVPIAGQVDYTKIVDPRKDLRFEDPANGATLAYEVETWTPNGESLVWVKVPRIKPAPAPAYILLHFGPNASNADPEAVWSDYEQVNHFAANADDSTAQNHDGTAIVGATTTTGFLGNAMTFLTGADRVTFAGKVFDSWHEGTLEMWIRPVYTAAVELMGEPRVITNYGALQLGRLYPDSGGTIACQIDAKWTGNNHSEIHPLLPYNAWTHLTWTYDQDVWQTYRDDQAGPMATIGNHDFEASPQPLAIGDDGSMLGARMQIDELRIAKKKRSAEWVRAQHASMTRNFVSFGDP